MSKVTQEEIIQILDTHGPLFVSEIAEIMNVISPRIQSGIHVLKSYGKVEQVEGRYKLVEIKENNKKHISIIINIQRDSYKETYDKIRELYLLKDYDLRHLAMWKQLWG